jgi:hypothetical protein
MLALSAGRFCLLVHGGHGVSRTGAHIPLR